MTREEAHGILSNGLANAPSEHEWCMAFEMAIKALQYQQEYITKMDEVRRAYDNISKVEPCEDCVRRKDVLDLVVANHRELNGLDVVMYSPLAKDIKQLPSVNSQTDILDKIVEELKTDTDKWWYGVDDDCFMKLSHVLAIIDKYKPKSKESTDADSD